jgi:hypothetical protein
MFIKGQGRNNMCCIKIRNGEITNRLSEKHPVVQQKHPTDTEESVNLKLPRLSEPRDDLRRSLDTLDITCTYLLEVGTLSASKII